MTPDLEKIKFDLETYVKERMPAYGHKKSEAWRAEHSRKLKEYWTPERKAAHSEKMRKIYQERKANAAND